MTLQQDHNRQQKATNPGATGEAHRDFLDATLDVWQPRARRALSREDAREIAHNAIGFFAVLRAWAAADAASGGPDAPSDAAHSGPVPRT